MITISKAARHLHHVTLLCLGLCSSAFGIQAPPPGGQQATVEWNASSDPTVVGYYLYYGTTNGVYTSKINVSANIAYTVSGLAPGSTYYFTTTSYNAAGVESSSVAPISYIVPGILAAAQNSTNGVMRVRFPVAVGQSYQLQASSDLRSWMNLWLTPPQTTNTWIEYDEPQNNFLTGRYYRLILNAP